MANHAEKAQHHAAMRCVRDGMISLCLLFCAGTISVALRTFDSGSNQVSMIFVLAVFLIARFTNGYFYGIAASFLSVLAVNYVFTAPYFAFNFTLAGYPLAMLILLAVSVTTSAVTSQAKKNENMRIEAEKEKTRSNLLRAVSHDLRTPLTGILGSTTAIIENDDVLTQKERLSLLCAVKEDAQWLIRMVENLLAVTRIDGDTRTKIAKQPQAAEEVVSAAVLKFQKRFPGRTVDVTVPEALLLIPMDATLIEQVLINLLENVVRHAGTADKIALSVVQCAAQAIFTVEDNGNGITPELLPHIFEGSYRHNSDKQPAGRHDIGIGLSVCNTIIQAHGGTMYAKNAPIGGAIFSFTLPLQEDVNG